MRARVLLSSLVVALATVVVFSTVAHADIVSSVDVEGNRHVSRDRILLSFGVRVGEDLSPEAVREGVRRLYEMGHFSDIRVMAEPSDDGSVRVIIVVDERPKILSIEITGQDDISDSDIESVLKIEEGAPFDQSRLEDSRVALLELYERRGFPDAQVQVWSEESGERSVVIKIEIEERTRVGVREIRFVGNESVDASDLKKVMETKEDRWWRPDAPFDRDVVEEDLIRVADRCREEGFIDAEALGYETEYDEDGEQVTLTITIVEGDLYKVSAVEWVGASEFAVDALEELTTLEVGDTYKPGDAEETIREAYSWYGERGYIHARIVREEDVEGDRELRVRFHVEESDPAHIGQIRIAGNKRTKEKIIRRELTVSPGDLYQTSEIIASQRRVANLGFFNGPMVEFTESSDPEDIDLVFTVEERQTGRAGVGMSHTSEKGITGFVEVTEGNLFGNGQYLDLKWEFGRKSTEVVLGFTEPWFRDRELSVGFDLYDTNDKRTYSSLSSGFYDEAFGGFEFPAEEGVTVLEREVLGADGYVVERDRRGGDIRLGWPFFGSRYTKIYTKYTLEQFKLSERAYDLTTRSLIIESDDADTTASGERHDPEEPDTDVPFFERYATDDYERFPTDWEWRSGLTTTFVRRTTDRRFYPRLGSYTRFSIDLFGWIMGGDVEYQRYILDTRKYFPSFWTTTLMLRGRGGIVTGFGDPSTVPDDTRFELGGVGLNGVRGYDNRSILPEGRVLYGGRTMLLGTAELRLPLTDESKHLPVHALLFADAGNTWEAAEDVDPGDLYWGAGAGLRVEVPVLGNLGVDFGYGFDEEEGGDWVVHYQFGVGF